eukprot:2779737-Prymnesium_polylepis.1
MAISWLALRAWFICTPSSTTASSNFVPSHMSRPSARSPSGLPRAFHVARQTAVASPPPCCRPPPRCRAPRSRRPSPPA